MLVWIKYLDRVIRGEANQPSALLEGEVAQPVGGLTVLGALLGVLYGLCMGCFGLFQKGGGALPQLAATMVKVPVLFFLTLAVTFPSLYVFNALVGSRLSVLSVLRLLVISLAVMLTVLASLGPIVAFFSASTTSYPFMLLLNVMVFSVAGLLGLRYLRTTLQRLSEAQEEVRMEAPTMAPPPPIPPLPTGLDLTPPTSVAPRYLVAGPLERTTKRVPDRNVRTVFSIWMVVFGLVGGQMSWVLRPFLGHPHAPFALLRGREASFFEAVFHALRALFG